MFPSDLHVRDEIAAFAARLIAEDGVDYASAKRRAVREIVGDERRSDCIPDNATVEAAVRAHQALFMADTQPARLRALRETALDVMRFLDDFHPVAHGAIVNGTAGEHSDIHLQVRTDNAKDVVIFLLNADIDFDAAALDDGIGESLTFEWPPRARMRKATDTEIVHLALVDPREPSPSRAARPARADAAQLARLIDAPIAADDDAEVSR